MERISSPATPVMARVSRTVPTKLQTAPTRRSPARRLTSSAPTSKSSVWMRTRAMASAPGHGREQTHLGTFAQRGVGTRHDLVDGHADRTAFRQGLGIGTTARAQLGQQASGVAGVAVQFFGRQTQILADRGETTQLDLHGLSPATRSR